jgi:hypothetical protein
MRDQIHECCKELQMAELHKKIKQDVLKNQRGKQTEELAANFVKKMEQYHPLSYFVVGKANK